MDKFYCHHCHLLLAPFEPRVKHLDWVFHLHCIVQYIEDLKNWNSAEFGKEKKDET